MSIRRVRWPLTVTNIGTPYRRVWAVGCSNAPPTVMLAPMGGTHQSASEFFDVVPNQCVVFSSGWAEPGHPIPSGSTRVEIGSLPDELATSVRLTHWGLPEDAVSDHTGSWDHHLDRLEVAATGSARPRPTAGKLTAGTWALIHDERAAMTDTW